MTVRFHRGRLLDHVHLHTADLGASLRFYKAVTEALGLEGAMVTAESYFYIDELFVDAEPHDPATRIHLAFQADSREAVERFHRAGLTAGGRDHGAPGERPYHPGYFAAFLLDPDGNNIEAVFHGPASRSAQAVIIAPLK